MINRAAVILKYREKALNWINDADSYEKDPGITMEDANNDRTVYLISDQNADSPEDIERWIKNNYRVLFETELESWRPDESLWPKNRSLKLFKEWFSIECHSMIEDTVGEPIIDEDI